VSTGCYRILNTLQELKFLLRRESPAQERQFFLQILLPFPRDYSHNIELNKRECKLLLKAYNNVEKKVKAQYDLNKEKEASDIRRVLDDIVLSNL
jgi:hypothetical protein